MNVDAQYKIHVLGSRPNQNVEWITSGLLNINLPIKVLLTSKEHLPVRFLYFYDYVCVCIYVSTIICLTPALI